MQLFAKQQLFRLMTMVIAVHLGFALLTTTANAMPLTQTEIDQKIKAVPEWRQLKQTITRTFEFKNFVEAIAFVDQLVEPAEAAGHHPDLTISYNKVTVSLSSHDAGGLTDKDFALAQTISNLAY
ncbi:MAG: pterin-4a-carbinolamine dehydratase [Cyanobacteriota bacterium]|jgi:4a-hydroxytetrahydrobiopterin dehydratase